MVYNDLRITSYKSYGEILIQKRKLPPMITGANPSSMQPILIPFLPNVNSDIPSFSAVELYVRLKSPTLIER